MKKSLFLPLFALSFIGLAACGGNGGSSSSSASSSAPSSSTPSSSTPSSSPASLQTITVAASESPHAEILNEAVKPLLEAKGYTITVTILDWTLQNEAVYNNDYDANYFQHRPYLQVYDSGNEAQEFSESYTYKKVFPTAGVHFEPLRIYPGKSTAADYASKKTQSSTTYCICDDSSNADRALDLLKGEGIISEDTTWDNVESKYSNITKIAESMLASSLPDYDYGVLPTNTALAGHITADLSLPVESDSVRDLRANVVAANVSKYASDSAYKARIDVLTDALLDSSVSSYILSKYNNVVAPAQKDYR